MSYLRLHSDGKIESVKVKNIINISEIEVTEINPSYTKDIYMHCLANDLFLLMHDDNDFWKNLKSSQLPINLALKKYFPNSIYVGDMILVKVDQEEMICKRRLKETVLKKYELSFHKVFENEEELVGTFSYLSKKSKKLGET